jgi:hypothetical protein
MLRPSLAIAQRHPCSLQLGKRTALQTQPAGRASQALTTLDGNGCSVELQPHLLAKSAARPNKSPVYQTKAAARLTHAKAPAQTLTALRFGAHGN